MNRRGMLVAGGSAAVALAATAVGWPGWLRKAFAGGTAPAREISPEPSPHGTPCPAGQSKNPLEASATKKTSPKPAEILLDAAAEQKKILVLVVPESTSWEPAYVRGHAFGEFFNHGSDADLAPLASAVVVCARMADLREVFGGAPAGEPLMVLVDPAARPASLRALDATIPQLPAAPGRGADDSPIEDKVIDARVALVASLVRQGLGAAPAAVVAARAAEVRERLVKQRPPGGQWASSAGCGVSFEEGPEGHDNEVAVACGMGHVPRRSARFLHFLSQKKG